jgi:uncharacterized membrane protein
MTEGSKNLTVSRGERSVWDKPRLTDTLSTYDRERWISAAVGVGLAAAGARRGGVIGGLMSAAGAALAIRAASGRHDVGIARDWLEQAARRRGWRRDVVADASEDSFPASDSPSWTAAAGAGSAT